jgi:hypothetical protein
MCRMGSGLTYQGTLSLIGFGANRPKCIQSADVEHATSLVDCRIELLLNLLHTYALMGTAADTV